MASLIKLARQLGPKRVLRAVAGRIWSVSCTFGLAATLVEIPDPRPAAIPIVMQVTDPQSFTGFDDEMTGASGGDVTEVEQRRRLCAAGARDLYVACADNGEAIYAQWLFSPGGEKPLQQVTPNQFRPLQEGEVLFEGAYTFVRYRKRGAMAAGMHQLLTAARDSGATRCITYVNDDNIPSLRGCANAGFTLDHVRITTQRLGRRRAVFRPPTPAERAIWDDAVAPRAKAV
jgi:RimJ/RimL family protein N-acetyltransferase